MQQCLLFMTTFSPSNMYLNDQHNNNNNNNKYNDGDDDNSSSNNTNNSHKYTDEQIHEEN